MGSVHVHDDKKPLSDTWIKFVATLKSSYQKLNEHVLSNYSDALNEYNATVKTNF